MNPEFPQVIVYGIVCLDQYVRVDAEGRPLPGDILELPGGEAFNTATALVGWGIRVLLTGTAFGTDPESDRLRHLLDTLPPGIARDYLPDIPGAVTPVCTVSLYPDGEREMSGRGFAQAVPPPPLPEPILAARPIFATDPNLGKASVEEALRAAAFGCPVVAMDFSHIPEVVAVSRILQESQERLLRQKRTDGSEADLLRLAGQWVDAGAETAIITRGAAGCVVADRIQGAFPLPAVPVETVVDTTGAGDTFRAGLYYGLLRNGPLREIVHFAAVVAARHCTVQGGGSRLPLPNALSAS